MNYTIGGGNIYLTGNTADAGVFVGNGEFQGDVYGTFRTLNFNITVVGAPAPTPGNNIVQENGFKIILQNDSGYLIKQ